MSDIINTCMLGETGECFINDDFLLQTDMARQLYHEYAEKLPIIDFHSHLDARILAENQSFKNLTELWVASDPYKHRAMRIAGVPERCITGDANDREKFNNWAETVPLTLGNPLYHWTALELKRYFDIDVPLCPDTAEYIWNHCNERLQASDCRPQSFLSRANVEFVVASDPPDTAFEFYDKLMVSDLETRVIPSPRDAGAGDVSNLDGFASRGCRVADHAIDSIEALEGVLPLAREYAKRGWIMQLHLGAQRQTSSRLRSLAGPAGGYATIGNSVDIPAICNFLDKLEKDGDLPRTILFPLSPADFPAIATMTGSFTGAGMTGRLQFGPAWWYNDHILGMRQHFECLASYGLLSTFIGMTTDSRALMSMVRHEYFRRVLCGWLAEQVAEGLMPRDIKVLGNLVSRVCYDNANDFLNFGK